MCVCVCVCTASALSEVTDSPSPVSPPLRQPTRAQLAQKGDKVGEVEQLPATPTSSPLLATTIAGQTGIRGETRGVGVAVCIKAACNTGQPDKKERMQHAAT